MLVFIGMRMSRRPAVLLLIALALCATSVSGAAGVPVSLPNEKLTLHYYKVTNSCRRVEEYVKNEVKKVWLNDKSVAPALARLLYSDCFVKGCHASILLKCEESEKTAFQNLGLRAFVLIDRIKEVLERLCPGVVSCVDILNLATRDALSLAGAPAYPVFTGRRDGMDSSAKNVDLPPPNISFQEGLAYFNSKGLELLDFATLLGAHTMGTAHCRSIRDRLYNFNGTYKADPNINAAFLTQLKSRCPEKRVGRHDPVVFLNLDNGDNHTFRTSYYSRVLRKTAVLQVDQQLLFDRDSLDVVQEFAATFEDFRQAFALTVSRMGNMEVLTGREGDTHALPIYQQGQPLFEVIIKRLCFNIKGSIYILPMD